MSFSSTRLVDSISTFIDFATPVFIPSLLVFAYHSSLSLRTWFAVQNAPLKSSTAHLPQPLFLFSETHQTRFSRLEAKVLKICHEYNLLATVPPLWLAFTLFAGMILQYLQAQPFGVDEDTFFRFALLPAFLVANSRLFTTLTGVENRLVFRSLRSRPFIQSYIRTDIDQPLAILPYLAAALVSYRTSFYGADRLSLSVTYGSLLHLLVSSEITVSRSFKAALLCAAVVGSTLLVLALALASSFARTHAHFSFLAAFIERVQLIFSQRHYAEGLYLWSSEFETSTAEHAKWPLFIISVLGSVFPADLISLCYRYDFHWNMAGTSISLNCESSEPFLTRHAEEDDDIPDNADVSFLNLSSSRFQEECPPSSASSTATLTYQPPTYFEVCEESLDFDIGGAHIPSGFSIPRFSMPYFCAAITTWVFCNILLYAVLQYSGMGSAVEFHYVESIGVLATMPAIVSSILVMAVVRNGVASLWHFAEQWSRTGESTISSVPYADEKDYVHH